MNGARAQFMFAHFAIFGHEHKSVLSGMSHAFLLIATNFSSQMGLAGDFRSGLKLRCVNTSRFMCGDTKLGTYSVTRWRTHEWR